MPYRGTVMKMRHYERRQSLVRNDNIFFRLERTSSCFPTFWRIFSYNFGCKMKALSDILASISPWKIANAGKRAINLQGFTHESGFSETLHSQPVNEVCCLRKCFTELKNRNLVLIVRSLFRNFNRCAGCFLSYMNIVCGSTQNVARIKRFQRLHISLIKNAVYYSSFKQSAPHTANLALVKSQNRLAVWVIVKFFESFC